MNDKINIEGIDRAELLAALHNGTRPLGMGFLHDLKRDMTKAEATEILAQHTDGHGDAHFDYVCGRPLKVWFSRNTLQGAWLFDRDSSPGKCQAIIEALRAKAQAA